MRWSNNPLNDKELQQLEKAFCRFLYVFIKTAIPQHRIKDIYWPAVQSTWFVEDFMRRNIDYAKPTNHPVYWQ